MEYMVDFSNKKNCFSHHLHLHDNEFAIDASYANKVFTENIPEVEVMQPFNVKLDESKTVLRRKSNIK